MVADSLQLNGWKRKTAEEVLGGKCVNFEIRKFKANAKVQVCNVFYRTGVIQYFEKSASNFINVSAHRYSIFVIATSNCHTVFGDRLHAKPSQLYSLSSFLL